jgi:hypothetical protein
MVLFNETIYRHGTYQAWGSNRAIRQTILFQHMDTIDKQTYSELGNPRWGRKSEFTDKLVDMEQGQMLFISTKEWEEAGYALSPFKLLNCYKYMKASRLYGRFDLKAEHKKEGWVIKHV